MADIKIGDKVKLKSGSVLMTVESTTEGYNENMIRVVWMKDGDVKHYVTHPDALEHAE